MSSRGHRVTVLALWLVLALAGSFAATGLPALGQPTLRWSQIQTGPGVDVTVPVGQTLLFDPASGVGEVRDLQVFGTFQVPDNANATLRIHRNFVIDGGRTIRGSTLQRFTVEWPSVVESGFVGGGDHVHALATDPGLWIFRGGRWEINGNPKRSWMRATAPIASGVSQITLPEDPTGWQVGDDVLVTPTEPVSVLTHWQHHEVKAIAAINGRVVTFSTSMQFPHPTTTIQGLTYGAEIANLSRNVRLLGRPTGRPHVMLTGLTVPQALSHIEIRYFGPRTSGNIGVLGRYPLHFHRNGNATRGASYNPATGQGGTMVVGVVIRDSGNMAFVAHASNGITFLETVAHNYFLLMRRGAEAGYWWDVNVGPNVANSSYDILYQDAGASFSQRVPGTCSMCQRGGGFTTSEGNRNRMVNVWATGHQAAAGGVDHAGVIWGESSTARGEGVWPFSAAPVVPTTLVYAPARKGAIVHNSRHGAFAWTNDTSNQWLPHRIDDFVAYGNSYFGIDMGAYANSYIWTRAVSVQNGFGALRLHSQSMPRTQLMPSTSACCPRQPAPLLTFQDSLFDSSGRADYAVILFRHTTAMSPTRFLRNTIIGGRRAGVGATASGGAPDISLFETNTFQSNAFWLSSTIPSSSRIQVRQDSVYGNLDVRRFDQSGTPRPAWNARVTTVSP